MQELLSTWQPSLEAIGIVAIAALVGLLLHYLFFWAAGVLTRRMPSLLLLEGSFLEHSRKPLRLLFPVATVIMALPLVARQVTPGTVAMLEEVLYVLVILSVGWLLVSATRVFEDVVTARYRIEDADNLRARKVITQMRILKRILVVFIAVLVIALVLVRYDAFRELGAGILASAGIAGIIIGFAAQRTLGNLLAGFQIAITQPIRVDDVVIVEGDFGWVEEITLTYVVVRIWDLRRVVLPISYFIEKPFQNWTRTSSDLLGTVFLYVDYTVPTEAVREELQRIVENSDRWDGKACVLQVTDTSERTVQLRALVSAASAPRLFELRCHVREKLVAYIQQHYPHALPTVRTLAQEGSEDGQPSLPPLD